MTTKLKLIETMWAEMRPDCYGGPASDQHIPGWHTYSEGDKEGTDGEAEIVLAARCFPPGTRIVISEPLCPKCDEPRIPKPTYVFYPSPLFSGPCPCGFDWDAWAEERFG